LTKPADTSWACPMGKAECAVIEAFNDLRKEVEQLATLSQTDPLTGLFNFRYMLDALNREMERTRRTGLTTALIMIDLDHFKQVNDTYGHQVGNRVLKWCATLWLEAVRQIDVLCRYGGEEFSVILPATRLSQAVRVAERLRRKLEQSPISLNPGKLVVRASFGVDVYHASDDLTPETFIEKTDRFLLEAKSLGRNRVCFEESKVIRPATEVTANERVAFFATRWPQE
jgi:two-component system cell cycle response regulator